MFAPTDLATIAAWITSRPLGLRGDVAADHDDFCDVLEVFRGDPNRPLYFIAPHRSGGLEVSPSDLRQGAFRIATGGVETATVADITAALAMVERVELRALGGGR